MSLQASLDALTIRLENERSKEVVEALNRDTQELVASGQALQARKVGDMAPPFSLLDSEGGMLSLNGLLEKGPLVISFFRGRWCEYCNLDLKAIERVANEVRKRGASIVAISPQTAANSRRTIKDLELGFPIISDKAGKLAAAFGVLRALPEYVQETQMRLGVDLSLFNGDNSWTLPMPARYVVNRSGVIVYAEVNPDYTRRPDPEDMLPVLDKLT